MAETFNRLKIEINQPVTDIITAVQDDTNSRYLDVFIYDNGTPIDLTGHEVRIFVEKPATNGEQFTVWNNGEITDAAAGRCQFLLTTQMLAETGYLNVQISIWLDNTEILSTEVFRIFVTESLRSDGSVESSNEYGALVVLFQNLYESIDLMTTMVQNYGSAGEVAEQIPATTFWEMLESVYSMCKDAYENASVAQVLTELGDTADTGATATTGTVYGKLNEILGKTAGGDSLGWRTLAQSVILNDSTPSHVFSLSLDGANYIGAVTFCVTTATPSGPRVITSNESLIVDGISYPFELPDVSAAAAIIMAYNLNYAISSPTTVPWVFLDRTEQTSLGNTILRKPLHFFTKESLELSFTVTRGANDTSDRNSILNIFYIPLD